ncbi:competence protein ComK [Halalkalibacillus halophilus]|uniref:competence protein ComK n=1 Tax=Halalkalibacillus halophilus TaxID=392827 RepID=UPI0004144C15|nr:competence protein ComK [Halalkalibacillus halophilus]
MNFKDKPRVSDQTMLIMPYTFSEGVYGSYVLEKDEEYFCYDTPKQLMNDVCNYYSCSLKGRIDGTKKVFGVTRKAPIVIEPVSGMFFLPTTSPSARDCMWIAHSHVQRLEKVKQKETQIYFHGGKTLTVELSYTSLTNQLQRTAQYRHLVMERISQYS